ncbi:hypothetical protein ACIHFD_59240 [Nonomuraea sp. NPDC051941]
MGEVPAGVDVVTKQADDPVFRDELRWAAGARVSEADQQAKR